MPYTLNPLYQCMFKQLFFPHPKWFLNPEEKKHIEDGERVLE